MVTERVRTLPTEPTDREIVKSHPLLSFINIGQRGRMIFIVRLIYRDVHTTQYIYTYILIKTYKLKQHTL